MKLKCYPYAVIVFSLFLCIISTVSGFGQNPFVSVWKTDNPGTSSPTQILFPASGEFSYSWVNINDAALTGSGTGMDGTTITFPQAGSYEVRVTPAGNTPFHRIGFIEYGVNDRNKLLEIKSWGSVQWSDFQFNGCSNLKVSATDIPDLSNVTALTFAFSHSGIDSIPNVNSWDMSQVTDLSNFFEGVTGFNQSLSNWDVSNVTSVAFMFDSAISFNQPLNTWDVSNVIDISYMFRDALSFNQSLASWNLESLTGAVAFVLRTAMNCENYSYTLHGWANNPNTHPNVTFGAYNVSYSPDVVPARDYLIDSLNWDFQSGDVIGTCNVALGVDFKVFTVRREQARAVLNWTTAGEVNNSGFEIQRSADGRTWKAIGFAASVAEEGNSAQALHYHFYDADPLAGANYYRLKQVDLDKAFTYSGVRMLVFAEDGNAWHLYPNPAGNKVVVSGLLPDQTIQLFDLNGKALNVKSSGSREGEVIDLSSVAPGIYYLRMTSATGQVVSRKLVRR